jgi:hypothetical protein
VSERFEMKFDVDWVANEKVSIIIQAKTYMKGIRCKIERK